MKPELEAQPFPERNQIEMLPEALGYRETEELARLSEQLVASMKTGEDTRELATRYMERAEMIADGAESDNPEGPRLGLDIRLTLLRRDGGRTEDYWIGLEDAYVHALQMGLDDVADVLLRELEEGHES